MFNRPSCLGIKLGIVALGLGFVGLGTGCVSYHAQSQGFVQNLRGGDLRTSLSQIESRVKTTSGARDELVTRLELGATQRAAALADPASVPLPPTEEDSRTYYLKRAIETFDVAEQRVDYWEEQARLRVGSEFGAMLTNQASVPYRGRAYDKVMLNTYKALSYLELGEIDKARVELNRSLQRQRDAVAANQKQIAAAVAEAELASRGQLTNAEGQSAAYDPRRATSDARTGPALSAVLSESIAVIRPYGDYVNPFSVFLDGLFFSVLGEGGSDLERGRKSFERVASLVPDNPYVQDDLKAANHAAEGKPITGVTYVIFETGTAPERGEAKIDIPTYMVTSKLAYVGAAFPRLVFNHSYVSSLEVVADGNALRTATVASIDSVIANDFKNEWSTIVTKTLITTATKAIAQAVVQKQMEDEHGPIGGALAGLAMMAVNMSTNAADTRTWASLPKEFQYARLATPANRELVVRGGGGEKTVALEPGSVNVVYVKSTSPSAPLLVSSFVLK